MEVVGIDAEKVKLISSMKKEDDWVLNYRLDSFKKYMEQEMV